MQPIPFNKPCFLGHELEYIKKAVQNGQISGNGIFTRRCQELLNQKFQIKKSLLTNSCTSALEMAALLVNLKPGDEVIMPSFTFVSTANAFALRGAKPRFVDIREDTLNMDERQIASLISKKTKAICAVHYAGVGCEMDTIMRIAKKKSIEVIEDAAQAIDAKYRGQFLGTIGHLGAFSFHETKNCISGEGGALLVNKEAYFERSEIIWEKGTDRCRFFRGEVDKYTWQDIGSSFLPSDLIAAFLCAQLENIKIIKSKRKKIFEFYSNHLRCLERRGIQLPHVPSHCETNYHAFYLILPSEILRNQLMSQLRKEGILAIFHYVPLHLSRMGKKFGYRKGEFPVSERVSSRLLRLPFYNDLKERDLSRIVKAVRRIIG